MYKKEKILNTFIGCSWNSYSITIRTRMTTLLKKSYLYYILATFLFGTHGKSLGQNSLMKNQDWPIEKPVKVDKDFYDSAYLRLLKERKNDVLQNRSITLERFNPTIHSRRESYWALGSVNTSDDRVSKRSIPVGATAPFTKPVISWMMTTFYQNISRAAQKHILKLSLAKWERSANICFMEVVRGADFYVGFYPDRHNLHNFDGVEAHSKSTEYIHLNNEWVWRRYPGALVNGSTRAAVLPTVLEHEIGHLIGLDDDSSSTIMHTTYNRWANPGELSYTDRENVKSLYGKCTGRFDSMVDLLWRGRVRGTGDQSYQLLLTRTLLTRDNLIWDYSNVRQRPNIGYPVAVNDIFPWSSAPTAIFQLNLPILNYTGPVYTITGDSYRKYSMSVSGRIVLEQEAGSVTRFGLPTHVHVDSAAYDNWNKYLHFVAGPTVYVVQYRDGDFSVSQNSTIGQVFPPATGETETDYLTGVDSIYFAVFGTPRCYILKGLHIWEAREFYPTRSLEMTYIGKQDDAGNEHRWDYVCNPFSCK